MNNENTDLRNEQNNKRMNEVVHETEPERHPETVSVGLWVVVFIVMAIPLVNIIMLIVWAIEGPKPSITTYARAALLLGAIMIGLGILSILLLFIVIGANVL